MNLAEWPSELMSAAEVAKQPPLSQEGWVLLRTQMRSLIGIEVAGKVDAAPRNSYGGFESNGFDVFFHGRNRVFLIAGCQGERGRQQYGKQILCFHHHAPFLFS